MCTQWWTGITYIHTWLLNKPVDWTAHPVAFQDVSYAPCPMALLTYGVHMHISPLHPRHSTTSMEHRREPRPPTPTLTADLRLAALTARTASVCSHVPRLEARHPRRSAVRPHAGAPSGRPSRRMQVRLCLVRRLGAGRGTTTTLYMGAQRAGERINRFCVIGSARNVICFTV
jgi:hypothetical protein